MLGILAHSLRTATRNEEPVDPDQLRREAYRSERRALEFELMWANRFLGRPEIRQRRARSSAWRSV
jgi:hypothetical protein